MKINSKILEVLAEFKINKADAICYLISLYHGYEPTYIPDILKQKINLTKIIVPGKLGLEWNVSLYEGAETAFGWVKTEYVPMFKEKNKDKGGKVREATARMKKLFASNPDVRKEEIIGATRMYLSNTDYRYIRDPHYFVEKGSGVEKTSDLLDWIDKYRLSLQSGVGRSSVTNTMQ